MASGDDDVVYKHTQDSPADQWDDEALIKAYSKAISTKEDTLSLAKPETSAEAPRQQKRKKQRNKHSESKASGKEKDWKVGDFCRCTYSLDGQSYEAKIKSVDHDTCVVRYIGYGNEEEVSMCDLLPSEGKQVRLRQKEQAELQNAGHGASLPGDHGASAEQQNRHSAQNSYSAFSYHACPMPPVDPLRNHWPPFMPPFLPPPPPPSFSPSHLMDNEEALASMLMSWYMTGYHTGYYQGMQEGRALRKDKGCCRHSCHD
ncbi:survival motor neuron protein 1-like isoform X2 [Ornithodoros turicata]|uniref:survival motor neuron protein 1-like isoform X2 n=1 Tax=Ornithodoros turicata TaxID=34597 RepID=UPI00313A1A40